MASPASLQIQYADIQSIVLAPNGEHQILKVGYPEADIIHRAFKKIDFQLCYYSIQQEFWHIDGLISRPEPGCP